MHMIMSGIVDRGDNSRLNRIRHRNRHNRYLMLVGGHIQSGPGAKDEHHVHILACADPFKNGGLVFGALFYAPVARIVAVLQKFQPITSGMFAEPFPHGAGILGLLRNRHVTILDCTQLCQALGGGEQGLLILEVGSTFHIDDPPFFHRFRICADAPQQKDHTTYHFQIFQRVHTSACSLILMFDIFKDLIELK